MQLSFSETSAGRKKGDLIVLAFWEDKKGPKAAGAAKEFGSLMAPVLKEKDFKGKAEECVLLYKNAGKEPRVLLLGLGKEKDCDMDCLRKCYAAAVKVCKKKKAQKVNIQCIEGSKLSAKEKLRGMCEGLMLADYAFDQLKSESVKEETTSTLTSLHFVGVAKEDFLIVGKTLDLIRCVNFTRDLVNDNADTVTAQALSSHAKAIAKAHSSVHVTVLGRKELEKAKAGLILAVNQGALRDPALIILEYKGNPKSKEWTAIVGKGMTYDTGGLNMKPTGSMETMKCDMAGAAAVLGSMQAAAKLGIKHNIIGVIASAENAVGPGSYKPGDVIKSLHGRTVEITNTDAEGRLVLADALSYLQKHYSPSRIIDLATLTGGIVIALGEEATGLFSNNDDLSKKLTQAGEATAERIWRMPLYPEYKDMLKSSIADIKNSAGRKASSGTGAIFIEQFIENNTPWAHLDIAGTAFLSELKPYHPTSATGVGVRLLIEYFENLP